MTILNALPIIQNSRCIILSKIARLYQKVVGKSAESQEALVKAETQQHQGGKKESHQRATVNAATGAAKPAKRRPTPKKHQSTLEHRIIPRSEHSISRTQISENALKVLYRLNKAGYEAYLVGGGVRDILLGRNPKDFDIATNATPEQIKAIFNNCRLIGRRFRLAHILFGRDVIEVATFRGHHHQVNTSKHISAQSEEGMLLRDNVYGTMDEDAERRDFTINALYYSVKDFSLHEFANGLDDLAARRLELIGDPQTRYREDPVRMLRAVRFAGKLDMVMTQRTEAPIRELAPLLSDIPAARLFDEVLKLFLGGAGVKTYHLLRDHQLFDPLFPEVAQLLTSNRDSIAERMIEEALLDTDRRVAEDKRINPAYLYSAILWNAVQVRARALEHESGLPWHDAFMVASNEVLDRQVLATSIPRHFSSDIRDIWTLQLRMTRRQGRFPERCMEHPKFKAAYDFLLLRNRVERGLAELAEWWERYFEAHPLERPQLQKTAAPKHSGHPRRRKPRSEHSAVAAAPSENHADEQHEAAPRKRRKPRKRYPKKPVVAE